MQPFGPAFCNHCGYDLRQDRPIGSGGLFLDPGSRIAIWRGQQVRLRPSTFEALHALVKARGAAVSHGVLAERIGSEGEDAGRSMAVRIAEIRRVMPGAPIINLFGHGYAWRPQGDRK